MTTEKTRVLDNIPVDLNVSSVLERLKLRAESNRIRDIILELIEMVTSVARPKALYKISQANSIKRKILVDGVEFTSYIPTLSFSQGEVVFPYVATCGLEVDSIKIPTNDFMKHYCLNLIKEMILRSASRYLLDYLIENYEPAQLTRIGPGEALGPLTQQRELFSILGDVENKIGVRLTDHNMMVPEKSSSGIYFETTVKLESCQLCPDTKCEGRRAPYQPDLLSKYRKKG
ncbi:MAG: vitamin B12 dependent-methionine synthase activation domain-containing protein [Dehalococcoidales bacterium]